MIIDVSHDEIMPAISAAYRFDIDAEGYTLRIFTLTGEIRYHFKHPGDARAFVNRIVQAVI